MILIMAHTKFTETFLTNILSKLLYKIISVPHETAFQPAETHIPLMQEAIRQQKNSEDEIDYILLESNYGAPAEAIINQSLFDHILTSYNNAKIIAFSSTTDSLVKALAYNPRICAMCKDPSIVNEVAIKSRLVDDASSTSDRIMTIADLRKMLDLNKRRISAPPITTPFDNNQTPFSPTTRNRSASLPTTFTPSFDTYEQDHTSTATTTTTNQVQESYSHGNNLNFK